MATLTHAQGITKCTQAGERAALHAVHHDIIIHAPQSFTVMRVVNACCPEQVAGTEQPFLNAFKVAYDETLAGLLEIIERDIINQA